MPNPSIRLSPNSLNLFLECPHCFWLEKKKGIKRPQDYPYSLNAAIDALLKQEFDDYRKRGEIHPLILEHKIQGKLFPNQDLLDKWRNNIEGLRYFDRDSGAVLLGAPDDVLEFSGGELAPLDYKSAGSSVSKIYDRFQLQMDTYTFLLEKNGFKTKKKGYLAFYVVDKSGGFNDKVPFKKEFYEIDTDPADISGIFNDAVSTLRRPLPPLHGQDCHYAKWLKVARNF